MNPLPVGGMADVALRRRCPGWRNALAGLTPKVFAIVAALMFARVLSAMVDADVATNDDVAELFSGFFSSYCQLLIMAAPMLLITIATANVGPQQGPKRIAALAAAIVVSAGVGAWVRMLFVIQWFGGIDDAASFFSYVVPRYVVLGGMLTAVGEFHRHEIASIEAARRADVDRASFEREITEARLQVLQAQVEPHFLFNTLANVRRLYEQHHAAGRTMLENLMRYFEVALPHMRYSESTLERKSAQTRTASFPCRAIPMSGVSRRAMPPPLAAAIIAPRASRVSTRALLLRRHVAALNRDRRPRPSSRG